MEKLACLKLKGKAEPLTIGFGPTKFLRETDWFYGYFLSLNNLVLLVVLWGNLREGRCTVPARLQSEQKEREMEKVQLTYEAEIKWPSGSTISQCFTPAFKKASSSLDLEKAQSLLFSSKELIILRTLIQVYWTLFPFANSLSSLLMLYSNSYTLLLSRIPPA